MIDASSLGSVTAAGTSTGADPVKTPGTLDKNDFLRLLITQLRNQNPLQPVDQSEFLSQTAQFTALEQLTNINRTLGEMQSLGGSGSSALSAASLIGRSVRVAGRAFQLDAGGTTLPFTLDGPATRVALDVVDADGNLLRRLDTGSRSAGKQELKWDGRDTAGKPVAAGSYFYKVTAQGASGASAPLAFAAEGPVTGVVTAADGRVFYRLGDTVARLEDVIDVR